jgi:hypothetical protein
MRSVELRTIAGIALCAAVQWAVSVRAAHAQGAEPDVDDSMCPQPWNPGPPDHPRGVAAAQLDDAPTFFLICDGKEEGHQLTLKLTKLADLRDGYAQCPRSIPDDYDVVVDTGTDDDYIVVLEPGDSVIGIIHGSGNKGLLSNPGQHKFDKLENLSDATFSVRKASGGTVLAKAKIKLLHRYWINLGIAVLLGSGVTTYAIANKTIQENLSSFDVSYDGMFHFYPFGARVFDYEYDRPYKRISLVVGFQLSSPTTGLFAGLGFEPIPGATVVFGIQPRRVARLRPGVVLGAMNGDASIPTDMIWSGAFYGGGISFDTNVAKAIMGAFR